MNHPAVDEPATGGSDAAHDPALFESCPPSDDQYKNIRMATYNIMCAEGNNLNMALRAMAQMRVEFGIFTEAKLTHDKYTHNCCGYTTIATQARSKHQGGVILFYRTRSSRFALEDITVHGPNVISCTLVLGCRRFTLIGGYVPPSEVDGSTLAHIASACRQHNPRHSIVFLGDINADLLDLPDEERSQAIADVFGLFGLEDISSGFSKTSSPRLVMY